MQLGAGEKVIIVVGGAGGGNYGGYGEPGRISTSPKTGSTDGKLGGGTGHTMNQSAGAGGGAGWYGGSEGPEDGVGHGGISGYNEYDFKFFYENPGHNGVDSNEVNGHVAIRKIGD